MSRILSDDAVKRINEGRLNACKQRKLNCIKTYNDNPKYCKYCGEVLEYKSRTKVFCNRSHAASFNNTGMIRIKQKIKKNSYCLQCGEPIKYDGIFCNNSCQMQQEYYENINKQKCGIHNGVTGLSTVKQIKRYIIEKYGNECMVCGQNKINKFTNKVPLDLHHIDGDYTNNKEENLLLICPNCHSLTNTYKAGNNNKSTRLKRLTVKQDIYENFIHA